MPQRLAPILALGLVLAICGVLWSRTSVRPLGEFDQTFYIGIAYDLRHSGTFTNGFVFANEGAGPGKPGMRFAPLYPALVAASAALDPQFDKAIDCIAGPEANKASCPSDARLLRLIQVVLVVGFYWLIWWMAGELLGQPRAAWLALVVAVPTMPSLLRYANFAMTEILALALLTAAMAAAVAARRGRPLAWLCMAGVLLGLTALTRPSFLYLAYGATLVGLGLVIHRGPRLRRARLLLAFVIGVAAPVLPWIARNAVVLGRPALSDGYASHVLVSRIAYNQMTWKEYGAFYICELPDGKGLLKILGAGSACDRFSWDPSHKDAFNIYGNGPFMDETVAAAGGRSKHLSYLLRNYILQDPLKHLLVTIPFALVGAWINHWWGFVLGIACLALTIRALRIGDTGMLIVTLPGWFMLLFHAAVAVNQPRYNLGLIVPYSIAGAWLIERGLQVAPWSRSTASRLA